MLLLLYRAYFIGQMLQLKSEVVLNGVTLDHIPKTLSPNGKLDSAPKEFSVYVSAVSKYFRQTDIWMFC